MNLKQSIHNLFGFRNRQEEEKLKLEQDEIKKEIAEKEKEHQYLISFCNNLNREPAEVNYRDLTFMLVDDFQAMLNMHCEFIIGLGARCVPVRSAEEALKLVDESEVGTYDVVLTDIAMQPMSGLEFVKKLRMMERPDVKEMVVLAVTVDYPTNIYESGFNGYMQKPLDMKLLQTMMERYLKK